MAPTAHIIAIGSEMLHGGRRESNSVFIADALARGGVEVKKKIIVGDNEREIKAVFQRSIAQADFLVMTGGLGSTVDDCTREAVAATLGRRLILRKEALRLVTASLRHRGRHLTSLIKRQALVPVGAKILPNPVGTAPGLYLHEKNAHVFLLPGVPREAEAMMIAHLVPFLQKRQSKWRRIYWTHSFNTVGIPETEVQESLATLIQRHPTLQFSFLASTKGVRVTISCWLAVQKTKLGLTEQRDLQERAEVIEQLRSRLNPWLFSEGDEELEEVVGKLLVSAGLTLGVAESCTGGLVAHRLTNIPGSSTYLDLGIVSYSNRAKHQLLGISPSMLRTHGAVSLPVAQAMACGVKKRSRVHVGIGITGIAGPGGGSRIKPVGLVCMAIDGPFGKQAQQYRFWGNRTEIKFRSSQAALDMIRRYLLDGINE